MIETTRDLLLAILSMDSYNRGYGAGIELSGTQLGVATITTDSERELRDPNLEDGQISTAQAAGFYAVAYEVKAGAWEGLEKDTTVISYRETDDFAPQYV